MFRLFVIPVIIGILVFLSIFYISPEFISESQTVSNVAEFVLKQSNAYFDTMPSVVVRYIAGLNLLVVSISGALGIIVVTQLLLIVSCLFVFMTKAAISHLHKETEVDEVSDLPPIEMDSKFSKSAKGEKVLGKGFDSIDRDKK